MQVSDNFSKIRLIAETTLKFIKNNEYKVFGHRVFVLERIVWHLKAIPSV